MDVLNSGAKMHDTYESRLLTFEERHDVFPVAIQDLAAAGFCWSPFTKNPATVRCEECGLLHKSWKKGDNPIAEHVKYSSDCDLIQKIQSQLPAVLIDFHTNEIVNTGSTVDVAAGKENLQPQGSVNKKLPSLLNEDTAVSAPGTDAVENHTPVKKENDPASRHGLTEFTFHVPEQLPSTSGQKTTESKTDESPRSKAIKELEAKKDMSLSDLKEHLKDLDFTFQPGREKLTISIPSKKKSPVTTTKVKVKEEPNDSSEFFSVTKELPNPFWPYGLTDSNITASQAQKAASSTGTRSQAIAPERSKEAVTGISSPQTINSPKVKRESVDDGLIRKMNKVSLNDEHVGIGTNSKTLTTHKSESLMAASAKPFLPVKGKTCVPSAGSQLDIELVTCKKCGSSFDTRDILFRHVFTDCGRNLWKCPHPFVCRVCRESYPSRVELKRHCKDQHDVDVWN